MCSESEDVVQTRERERERTREEEESAEKAKRERDWLSLCGQQTIAEKQRRKKIK